MKKLSKKIGALLSFTKKATSLKRSREKRQAFSNNVDNCNVYQFKMVHNTRDVRYLYKLDNYDELPEESEGLHSAWNEIYQGWNKIIGGNRAGLSFLKQKHIVNAL